SNAVSQTVSRGTLLWLGTGKGAARTSDGGRTFVSYRNVPQFARPGIFALDVKGDTIWCSTGYIEQSQAAGNVQTGAGYAYTFDNGGSWHSAPQPIDGRFDTVVTYGANTIHFLPIVVPEQNVTFRLDVTDSAVWVASWSSGLRKSTDNGATWQRTVLPADSLSSISPSDSLAGYVVDPRVNNNFLLFSVYVESPSIVWAGSAGGINRSPDGGVSWKKFTATNQVNHILANWVIAIRGQRRGAGTRVWTANWPATSATESYSVSFTDDSGKTWSNTLIGIKAYDFAFKDSVVYVASDQGLYRSSNGGISWEISGTIVDPGSGNMITSPSFYAVAVVADTVYGGNADGLVRTVDNATNLFGASWKVLRTSQPAGSLSTPYSYPNPFSPKRESVRFHYNLGQSSATVSIEVFDFAMNRVRTVLRDAPRSGQPERDEVWDGRDEQGSFVLNGVYFFRVTVNGGTPAWGKVMVIQ
ncbi:MAG TPA: FlgD immunoglobulin-like domain containing protein, partial [Bacteroidota bacterium]|nr:FlgD immunoglobulin-like domain containing protein [Bacteroidota bacterium]